MKTEKLGSPSARKMVGLFLGSSALYMGGTIGELRNCLPEPFDLPDHLGNVVAGTAIGSVVAIIGSAAAEAVARNGSSDLRKSPLRFRALMAAGSMALGAIANGLTETKLGVIVNVPDQIDFAYGVIASGIFGAVAPGPYSKGYLETATPI